MPFWGAVAVVNMAIGVVLATHPQRASDFRTVRAWTSGWLFQGIDLYAPLTSGTDYPPHAIVALSPISLLPAAVAVPAWAALNLLLAIGAPFLAARIVCRETPLADAASLAVLFLCWSGSKSLLQFTLLTLVFGLGAIALAERRPRWSGVCLGLAMMKPQIGLPFLLWALFARRWKVVVTCVVVIAAGSLAWCLRANANPLHVAVRYLQILHVYYAAPGSMVGVSQVGPLIARFFPDGLVGWLTGVVSLALLAIVCVQAWRARQRAELVYAAPAMAGLWSLATFYHLTYGFVLLLPTAALLLLSGDEAAAPLRRLVFWVMQAVLVVDLPGLWRRFAPAGWRSGPADAIVQDWYRIFVLVVFAVLMLGVRSANRPRAGTAKRRFTDLTPKAVERRPKVR